jgi:uncharacterized protein (TIGR02118 family)
MLKAFHLLAPVDGASAGEFAERWRSHYAPLVAVTPGLRRYVCLSESRGPSPFGISSPFAGIEELWFDDLGSYHSARAELERRASEAASELLDPSATRWLAAHEHVVLDRPAAVVKALFLFRRRPDLTLAQCQQYWRTGHAALVPRSPGLIRYVQSHVLTGEGADEPGGYDGVAEAWFPDLAAIEAFSSSPEFAVEQARDIASFVDVTQLHGFLSDAQRQVL